MAEQPGLPSPDKGRELLEHDPASLSRAEVCSGRYPGHERIRILRPRHTSLQRVGTGLLQATEEADIPHDAFQRAIYYTKRALIGAPIASSMAEHERLTKVKALAVLSSDAISSVAYATEACLVSLLAAGIGAASMILPISIAITILLMIVAISYRQTIPAYPNGGGSYIVAKDNLGVLPGLIAAAALLIDYVLTVAVSVASGVQNLASLFPTFSPYIVEIGVALVILIAVVNLRGVRESGSIFAIPTYFFIVCALFMIILGLIKGYLLGEHGNPTTASLAPIGTEPLTLFLILKSFAAGCSAMTGVEAISNGVPAFKRPEPRNAATTLTWMAIILGTLFIGITLLTMNYRVLPNASGNPTVIAQIATTVFSGPLTFMFPVFQLATLLVLTLAANTSYADFPRLASLLARDHFLPHQFAFRGDRLAFSTGIVFLAILAVSLLIIFHGDTNLLINLYAVGVFLSFTLSQSGMVLHWWRLRGQHRGWQRSMMINGLGAGTTLVVTLIIAVTKFMEGAWIVVLLIPLLVLMFQSISKHYMHVIRERTTTLPAQPTAIQHLVIVPIASLDRATVQSLAYARSITERVVAVHVAVDEDDVAKMRTAWTNWQNTLAEHEKPELVIIESPYRSLSGPILDYIEAVHELFPEYTITVLLPEFIVSRWWEHLLHNQTALRLKAALLFRPGIVVTSVPYHLPSRLE